MIVGRPAPPARRHLALRAVLRRAGAYWWWSLRTHVADLHGLPRPPPPLPPSTFFSRPHGPL